MYGSAVADEPGQKPLFIYCHIPFCRSKCHFCDWVQAIPKKDLLLNSRSNRRIAYINAMVREINEVGQRLNNSNYAPKVLYFGGGTASSLAESELIAIFGAIGGTFDMSGIHEATIECTPDSITTSKLQLFQQLGFNRISFGAQSFVDKRLKTLGRVHDSENIKCSVQLARDAGFSNINIDVMCGFPNESMDETAETINKALALNVPHISVYGFRPTEGTHLRSRMDKQCRRENLTRLLFALRLCRDRCRHTGYNEYAAGYFGTESYNVSLPFGLRIETAGFGSGATSLIGREYRCHSPGKLDAYTADPTDWDFRCAASATGVQAAALRAGLSLRDGLRSEDWLNQIGVPLETSMNDPSLLPLVNFLRRAGGLRHSGEGICLPFERASDTLATLAYDTAMAER